MNTTAAPEQIALDGIAPPPAAEPDPEVDAMLWLAVIGHLVHTPRIVTPTHDKVYLECVLRQHHVRHRGAKNLVACMPCTSVVHAQDKAHALGGVGATVVVHGTGLEDTTYRGEPVHKLVRTAAVLPWQEAERIHGAAPGANAHGIGPDIGR